MSELGDATLRAARRRETELSEAELRARGIVPTPLEVARYGVARLDALLRAELGIAEGLASERVVAIDPAVGTGVWLAALLEHTRTRGARAQLLGIDIDAAALASAAALLAPEADAQGAALELVCANALELANPFPAGAHVRVILGNPPWAARSQSRGGALSDAWLAEFRRDSTGTPLGERRAGVLSDDYVRFFRWALEQARTSPSGALLCFATNASFLDGPVHRGMRAAFLGSFDCLELVDLGGNLLLSRARPSVEARADTRERDDEAETRADTRERDDEAETRADTRERNKDENVFGVRVGAALTCAVRRPQSTPAAPAEVAYARLRGTCAEKLRALDAGAVELAPCAPCAPWFLFRPGASTTALAGFTLAEAFPFHREGVQTNRDGLAIARTRAELEARLHAIARGELALPARRHFDPARARALVAAALARGERLVEPLAYRPRDDRFFVTLAPLCHRPRPELARAVAHSSACLLAVRKERGSAPFNLFSPAQLTADACFLSTRSSCRTRVFPSHTPEGAPNLSPSIADALADRVGRAVSSAELIAYALGVLGSPRFRALHEQALKLDYARIPWPQDVHAFERALAAGHAFVTALADLAVPTRVLAAADIDPDTRFARAELRYDARRRRVMVAGRALCADISPAWWAAQVGHQRLVMSALRDPDPTVRELAAALEAAASWSDAEAAADRLELAPLA